MTVKKKTPLMKQYDSIKLKFPGAILLFRVGDFYETFGEDAIKTSKILDVQLTFKSSTNSEKYLELAGFPYHALENYLPKLVKAGYRVAICDQLEDPKTAKGIVKRGVTELVTPGLSLNDNVLDSKSNNYLCTLHQADKIWGFSILDISTGEFLCAQGDRHYVQNLIISFNPSEVVFNKDQKDNLISWVMENHRYNTLDSWVFQYEYADEKLRTHFNTSTLVGFGISRMHAATIAAGAALRYLDETEHKEVAHISTIARIDQSDYVWLDRFTTRNLELVFAQKEEGTPLIEILDQTTSPMGARLLKQWLVMPLRDYDGIIKRQEIVQVLYRNNTLLEKLITLIKDCGDLARLLSKLATQRINPRETVKLKNTLLQIPLIKKELMAKKGPLSLLADELNNCELLVKKIDTELLEDGGIYSNQGNIIKEGVDDKLDELKKIAFSGKEVLFDIQKRETTNTGISSLKIAFNKVYGYYLEVTNTHKNKVPKSWIRKQTLVSAERYITPELKEYEEKIVDAEAQISIIEEKIFNDLVSTSLDYIKPIQQNSQTLATLDCLMSFAKVAKLNNYCKPKISKDNAISIIDGRHPVIEKCLPPGEEYIPNSLKLDDEKQQILMITGPNMSGKSALLRQTALIVLMAQLGSFVPAKEATIGYVDKIFTRVGASDNLSKGESTFMVEMTETASILNNLSERSLIIMDEIGRGTSTYDGISIAWSIVEYLHNHPKFKAKTLFATHYHELNQLSQDLVRIKNYNVSVKQVGDKVVFLRKMKKGGCEHSFGIYVAQMAGMPNKVVIRASDIMYQLEHDKLRNRNKKKLKNIGTSDYQLNLFDEDPRLKEVKEIINALDINTISPVEALLKLNELKQKMNPS